MCFLPFFLLYCIYRLSKVGAYYFRRNSQIFMYGTIFLTLSEFNSLSSVFKKQFSFVNSREIHVG